MLFQREYPVCGKDIEQSHIGFDQKVIDIFIYYSLDENSWFNLKNSPLLAAG